MTMLTNYTKPPLYMAVGEQYCFHKGNRVMIGKYDPAEETDETVAEVWSADDSTDIEDGRLMTHAAEMYEELYRIVEALSGLVVLNPCLMLDIDRIKALLTKIEEMEI